MTYEELCVVGDKLTPTQKAELEAVWDFFADMDDIPEDANKGLCTIAVLLTGTPTKTREIPS